MTDHKPLELERFLPYRLSILSNRMRQANAREYQQRFDLSMTEWRVIAVLARLDGEPVSAREVAAYTAMDKVAISRALSRLVASGRVARRTDDGDKRRAMLRLTAKGWKIHDSVAPRARAHERAVLALLNGEERRTLERILDKLLEGRETGDRRRETKS
jgi:DNA-binding MarR family transcriptional regulator